MNFDENKNEKYEIIELETQESTKEYEIKNESEKKKSNNFLKSVTGWMLSAVIFGSLAGGSFYGVSAVLEKYGKSSKTVNAQTIPVSTLSENSLDVSEVASTGLSLIVSITNISVQEVQSYFGRFSNGRGQLTEVQSSGSGVILEQTEDALYLLTNYHVIEGAKTLSVTFIDDLTYEASIVGYDSENDIAVLKVPTKDMDKSTLNEISVAKVGDSSELKVGEQVVAIGNALGYGQSVTTGIVSAVDRAMASNYDRESKTYIQTDAAINPGNSGGALMNMKGELVGINTAKISSTNIEGMGYAIPIERILEIIGSIN